MRIRFDYSFAHFDRKLWPQHGPQVWPWWRLFSLALYRLEIHPPSVGKRLWLYTRWGACYFDLVFDRRTPAPEER